MPVWRRKRSRETHIPTKQSGPQEAPWLSSAVSLRRWTSHPRPQKGQGKKASVCLNIKAIPAIFEATPSRTKSRRLPTKSSVSNVAPNFSPSPQPDGAGLQRLLSFRSGAVPARMSPYHEKSALALPRPNGSATPFCAIGPNAGSVKRQGCLCSAQLWGTTTCSSPDRRY